MTCGCTLPRERVSVALQSYTYTPSNHLHQSTAANTDPGKAPDMSKRWKCMSGQGVVYATAMHDHVKHNTEHGPLTFQPRTAEVLQRQHSFHPLSVQI